MFYFKNIIYFILYIHLKMVIYTCPNCNKEFKKKYNFNYHINNKIRPCKNINLIDAPICTKIAPICTELAPNCTKIAPTNAEIPLINLQKDNMVMNYETKNDTKIELSIHDILLNEINKLCNPKIKESDTLCMYCDKNFTRHSSLQRHLKDRCKSKIHYDELEKIKLKFDKVMNNNELEEIKLKFDTLKNNNEHLLKEIEELKNQLNNPQIVTTNNNNSNNTTNNNTLNKNKINNGTINNNNLNVQLVQFVHDLLTF